MRLISLTCALVLAVAAILLIDGIASPRSIHFTIKTPENGIVIEPGADGAVIRATTDTGAPLSSLSDPGQPALPMRMINVLVPPGERVVAVRAVARNEAILARAVRPRLATLPEPDPDAPAPRVLPEPTGTIAPASDADVYPAELARYAGSGTWHGYTIASIAVFPLRMENGDLVAATEIELAVELEAVPADDDQVRALRMSPAGEKEIGSRLRTLVINPDDAGAYPAVPTPQASGAYQPSNMPSIEGSPVEYVIVTTEALAPAFDSLAVWKTARGVPTVVRTVEWIAANYRRGTDTAETVRFFLRDAYTKWGAQHVLLAGDTGEIPPRYLYSGYYYGGTLIPADIYFAGLDGSFNEDGDSRFGEMPEDAPDLWVELNVARLPVSTPAVANVLIAKIMRYETPADPEYTDKVLYLAEVLFPSPWSPGQSIASNGATYTEYLHQAYIDDPSRRITRCYETPEYYAGSVQESRAIAIDSLEAGYNMVFHVGHGYRFNMHCGDDNVAIPDADALLHAGREFNLYMLNCTAAAFDFDCLGEHMLRNPAGGAVSVIGAANSAFPDPASHYMGAYTQAVYQDGEVRIGEAFMQSRVGRTPFALLGDGADLWTHYIYAILADPVMELWTGPVRTPTVTVVDSLVAGRNDIAVQVAVEGVPVPGATVCLWKDGEDYAVGETNFAGSFTVPFTSAIPGSIRVVVTGTNLARRERWVAVRPGQGALLVVDSVTVDDDNSGASSGNGDGRIDAGETIELRPVFRNVGDAASVPAASALTFTAASITLTTANLSVPAIAPDTTWSPVDTTWTLQVAASAVDGSLAYFDATTLHGATTWQDGFSTAIHAPALELTGLRKSDELPVGNGDGVVAPGEDFLLFISIKNYGSGPARSLTASLVALDGGSTVTTGAASYPDVGLLESAENTLGFVLNESSVVVENPLQFTITDHEGRTLSRTIELRSPVAPSIQSFDATVGLDKIAVTWNPVASPDVAGYRVYRADAPGGPFVMATPDLVLHTIFTDAGLAANSRFYFAVTAVDFSGNESPYSAVMTASTNPPQMEGWPNEMPDPSANSPTIGDIDGDGYPEIVIGNETLYAWHHDGDEVRDGDGLPATWGVFAPFGTDFIGPAAMAEIDGLPGLEIAAAAYTSREMYLCDGTGAALPGWPQATIDQVRASVAFGDLDGDGDLEVVAVDQDAYLYAWHTDGSELVDGDANPATGGVLRRLPDTNQWQYQAPALADIDGDGKDEVIVATQDKKLYVLNEDGSDLAGWPRTLPNYAGGGVVVGDLDNNGDLEIVLTVRTSGETYALNHDNTVMWTRWLQHNLFFNPSPALADITGDGKLEVLIPSSNGRLYAIQYNGSDAPGWPVTYSTSTYTESSPIVADVTGDGAPDVLLGHEEKLINGWNAAGALLDGFPLVVKDAMRGAPAVVDLDVNGDAEIVAVGYDRTVYVWDLDTTYDVTRAPWPMLRANIHRNGAYQSPVATGIPGQPVVPVREMSLGQNYPNPFNPATTIAFELPSGRNHRVSLAIYDVTGARVRTLIDGTMPGGRHTAAWDGRNQAGSPVSSGVYFYRLAGRDRTETRKMVLLK
jgi:hypothetical protein